MLVNMQILKRILEKLVSLVVKSESELLTVRTAQDFSKDANYNSILSDVLDNVAQIDLLHNIGYSWSELEKLVNEKESPVVYLPIFEHPCVTMCVFIVKPGAVLPLHDHPFMLGIMKLLHGKLRIKNFNSADFRKGIKPDHLHIKAYHGKESILTKDSEIQVLQPKQGDIHEISALPDSYGVFLDILAPSYNLSSPYCDCRYYKESSAPNETNFQNSTTNGFCTGASGDSHANTHSEKLVYLEQVPCPDSYWCEQIPFLKPFDIDFTQFLAGSNKAI